tara:strand:- start:1722 stop:1934 length:213 start_codon:yes stop_codon:yes gene_type:complete
MKCSSYLYDEDIQGKTIGMTSIQNITFMELGSSSIPFEHHVLGWVKIKEYVCPKVRCSNAVAQVEFLEVE